MRCSGWCRCADGPSSTSRASTPTSPADGVVLTSDQFEAAVEQALLTVPEDLLRLIDNVAILVEDECPPDGPELLGVYEGTPLTERDSLWDAGSLPDRIVIFQGPLQRMARDRQELLDEIAVTVVHEIAHHFGISDDVLHDLGWG